MKKFIRTFVYEALALFIASEIASGLVFSEGLQSFLITSLALSGATLLIKPIINILLLPFNMVTFGLFKWISHGIVLYLVDLVLDEFAVSGFSFPGADLIVFQVPGVSYSEGVLPYIFFAFIMAIVTTIARWIRK